MRWQVQVAKQRFSELIRRALEEGPQIVTRHGEEVVVILAAEEFRRLRPEVRDFKEFLMSAPDFGDLEVDRDATPAPMIDLSGDEVGSDR